MNTLHFSIIINAPKEKVWKTMLEDSTYREWTSVFSEGSSFKGSWDKGSKIVFGDLSGSGMVATIAENKPYEFLSIKHLGYIKDGIEDTESEEIKAWAPAFENYTFEEKDGQTELTIDTDTADEFEKMFNELWPKALVKLKEIAER